MNNYLAVKGVWVKKKKLTNRFYKRAFKTQKKYPGLTWTPCAYDEFGNCHGLKAILKESE